MTRRLLLTYLSIAVLVLLCLEIPLGFVYSQAERDRIISAAHDEAASLSAYAELSLEAGRETQNLPRRVTECARRIGGQVSVVSRYGTVIASSEPMSPEQARDMAGRPEVAAALAGHGSTDVRTSSIGGVQYLSVAAPVGHETPPAAAVRVTVPTDTVHARVHQVWLLLALAGLAVLAAVAAVGFAIARWAGRPIRELEQATVQLAGGSLSDGPVTIINGPPEVRSLAAAFNQTAARLEHLLASQRAFAGEASHQLKTPLAALRLRLDNLEPAVADFGRGSLAAAQTETERLARMVEGLLAMARLEEKAATRELIDVERVCAERHQTWAPVFHNHGVCLHLTGERAGPVLALPGAVEQILDNLLSNALRHSPPGTTVTLQLRHRAARRRTVPEGRASWADLHVIDEGPGMTEEQRRRAFDRFWRAPDAPKGGTGLGLALVQRLAHASGGDVALRPAPAGGLDAVVSLPCTEQLPGTDHDFSRPRPRQQQPAQI
ncbi:HAMP domain-containing sensor histidine kinase [Streptomyces coeruleorubidus]|uniref:sensor histidine kinase n=1 Tax=Streptomyces coeruleorubidus TaxID=116188 RepID=UPI00237F20BD|nr:HAMP domain-containing sensor histidine kinase [Streptomyces coeruleorubidus]WDV49655.1 HAMP domain-containing sensor histidine kinase [Streptomyces coeruleorubidus]